MRCDLDAADDDRENRSGSSLAAFDIEQRSTLHSQLKWIQALKERFTMKFDLPALFLLLATHGASAFVPPSISSPAFQTQLSSVQNDSVNGFASSVGEATQRLGPMSGPTVWTEFARISQENDVANLGQGFPDWLPPQFAVDSLVEAALDSQQSPHQYTRTAGHPNLVNQLAKRYSTHLKREIDPMTEVSVTVGASQALYLSLQTLIQPGDEVILFEPFFDLYVNQVKLAGGTPVYVPLTFVPYEMVTMLSLEVIGFWNRIF